MTLYRDNMNVQRPRSLRISFKAYGFNHGGEIYCDGDNHRILLIDVNSGGARLRCLDIRTVNMLQIGNSYDITIDVFAQYMKKDYLSCIVRWKDAQEMGVQFVPALPFTVGELKDIFTR